MKQIPVIDIFAGPGGLSEGFATYADAARQHPFRIALSIEMERWAHTTLLLRAFCRHWLPNRPPPAYYRFLRGELDFSALLDVAGVARIEIEREAWRATLGQTDPGEVDERIDSALNGASNWILIGGPPCQAYSLVGRSRRRRVDPGFEDDPKHFLYREYLRILTKHKPPIFLMENVRGLLSSTIKGARVFDTILRDLRDSGYRLYPCVRPRRLPDAGFIEGTDFLIKAEEFGVPQRRHRVIVLGVRRELRDVFDCLLEPQDDRMSVGAAIAGLPRLRSLLSEGLDSAEEWLRVITETPWIRLQLDSEVSEYITYVLRTINPARLRNRFSRTVSQNRRTPRWAQDARLDVHVNHQPRGHIADDVRRYLFAAAWANVKGVSPKLQDFPTALLPQHANVLRGVAGEMFADRFRVQTAGQPGTTVTSHIAKDGHYFIHFDARQARSLTVREAARLQTFPDNYCFMGPRTAQYHQVGNAVPPLLATKLADMVHRMLLGRVIPDSGRLPQASVSGSRYSGR